LPSSEREGKDPRQTGLGLSKGCSLHQSDGKVGGEILKRPEDCLKTKTGLEDLLKMISMSYFSDLARINRICRPCAPKTTVFRVLHNLGLRFLEARRIPYRLSEAQKDHRVHLSQAMLGTMESLGPEQPNYFIAGMSDGSPRDSLLG
jgi:hypothetical protein